ncbi:MAG: hypothetical protein JWO95_2285 [Verrucomicrobiales bacterium]|nr:hypothetical protein [Verrucomicrobiales bacterium]
MIVVSDTSCISNLLTIGHEDLLSKVFGVVIIPPAVDAELRRFHRNVPSFISVRAPVGTDRVAQLAREIDIGEAQAIALAHELKADRLLIDEKLGRAVAVREQLTVIGIVGVLLVAKARGLVVSVKPLMDRLENEAGFRLAANVKKTALQQAGE